MPSPLTEPYDTRPQLLKALSQWPGKVNRVGIGKEYQFRWRVCRIIVTKWSLHTLRIKNSADAALAQDLYANYVVPSRNYIDKYEISQLQPLKFLDRFEINTLITTFREADWGFLSRIYRNVFKRVGLSLYSHITFGGVKALIKCFWGHPLYRKFFGLRWAVHVFIDLSHQPKVWHFDLVVIANKYITGSKVSVNKVIFCEMILITNKQRKND